VTCDHVWKAVTFVPSGVVDVGRRVVHALVCALCHVSRPAAAWLADPEVFDGRGRIARATFRGVWRRKAHLYAPCPVAGQCLDWVRCDACRGLVLAARAIAEA
jgi:hypothetical protein